MPLSFPLLVIKIGMDPELGEVLGFLITWHGVFTAIAIGIGVWAGLRLAERRQIDPDEAYTAALVAVAGGIVGARLLFVIEEWDSYKDNLGDILALNEGGISIYGAIVGGVLCGLVYAAFRRNVFPALAAADAGAVAASLGLGIGRIGDIINGEHVAKASDLPWAVEYTHANSISAGLGAQHPAVAYEMLGDIAIFGVLLWVFVRFSGSGWAFFGWMLAYGAMRFGVSFFREDELVLAGLRTAQLVAIGGMIFGAGGLAWLWFREEPAGPSRAERRREERAAARVPGPQP